MKTQVEYIEPHHCCIGDHLAPSYFAPGKGLWAINFDAITHYKRKFVREAIGCVWIRVNL